MDKNDCNEFERLFFKARSVRNFETDPVPLKTIREIIKLAGQAPSGLNKQPWYYCIIKDPRIKEKIREESEKVETEFYRKLHSKRKKEFQAMNLKIKKSFLTEAPYLVAVFARDSDPYYCESTWLSIGWFLLAVKLKGLSTLTYTPEKMKFLNKILNVEDKYIPQVILPVGYGIKKGKKSRKEIDDISEIL